MPAQVVVPAGATTAPFTFSARPDPHGAEVTLSITGGDFKIALILEVLPTPP